MVSSLPLALLLFQLPPVSAAKEEPPAQADSSRRVELNLLGKTDTAAGESRRNENVQFNLVDNNALKELNVRLGVTATIHPEFRPERNYFGAEYGNPPSAILHVPAARRDATHGSFYYGHLNSIFSARSFFQVGAVQPAREHDYGFTLGSALRPRWFVQIDGSQQKLRGNVNGNVLVPGPDERTTLATDPAVRSLVSRWLGLYPRELPNRTDINDRALNTNAPQVIDNSNGGARVEFTASARDKVISQYQFTSQFVDAFQLVAGQNPDTATRSHRARLTWNRTWAASTILELSLGFDRTGSVLQPEPNSAGPMVSTSGLTTLGPLGSIPINRAQNLFRSGATLRHTAGGHSITAGFQITRRQFNGIETDTHRGFFSFNNDFGRDAISNLRLGAPTQHIVSIGDVHRGFRNFDLHYYAGDTWRVRPRLQLSYALRWQPITRPGEVNGRNPVAYRGDWNNFAPQFGVAWRGFRAAYGLHYGEIFPVTFSQVRFSPPGSVKVVVTAPSLINPLTSVPDARGNIYALDPNLRTPYAHQYNASWEPRTSSAWRVQLGYVGSRQHKLLLMWYLNRAHAAAGLPTTTATINLRRPDPRYAEIRWVLNGSRGYFDAARATLVVPRWRGLSVDASYWFSKSLDLGSAYTNTAYEADSRLSRGQSEYNQHADMKALSNFDQPHAFLVRPAYTWKGFALSSVVLLKSGTPFTVQTGADGPGFGNVDGNGGDRPNLIDPTVWGRTVGHPDVSALLLPRSAFAYPAPNDEFGGNLGRNTFRKGGIYNVNASLARTFTLARDRRLTLRAESVNLLNTPQFAEPGADLATFNFGFITNTLNDGRTFRFVLQLGW
ncbi:MAG: hypothetical protein FJW39_05745 [Acidobacteria bacterium]|nr:hypothetical protein [Acidobacteriota bacterium]